MKSKIYKSIFLRKGSDGVFTKTENIIPEAVTIKADINPNNIILSYFKDDEEWFLLTESFIAFIECKKKDLIKINHKDIFEAKPFSSTMIGVPMSKNRNKIYINLKDRSEYCFLIEEGPPLVGVLQVLNHIKQLNLRSYQ